MCHRNTNRKMSGDANGNSLRICPGGDRASPFLQTPLHSSDCQPVSQPMNLLTVFHTSWPCVTMSIRASLQTLILTWNLQVSLSSTTKGVARMETPRRRKDVTVRRIPKNTIWARSPYLLICTMLTTTGWHRLRYVWRVWESWWYRLTLLCFRKASRL